MQLYMKSTNHTPKTILVCAICKQTKILTCIFSISSLPDSFLSWDSVLVDLPHVLIFVVVLPPPDSLLPASHARKTQCAGLFRNGEF